MTQRIPILMYHSISVPVDNRARLVCLPPEEFARQMRYIRDEGYTPVSLDALADGSPLPLRPVVLTFDDGYSDNYHNAFPVLQRYGFSATIFLVTGHIGSVNSWDGNAVPAMPLMGWDNILEMHQGGVDFGSHTVSHRLLKAISPEEARREIAESRRMIEDKLGCVMKHFAYPYGEMSNEVVEMVREAGYQTACSTRSGFNPAQPELFSLRRIDVYGTDTLAHFARKLTYGTNAGGAMTTFRYYWKRLARKG